MSLHLCRTPILELDDPAPEYFPRSFEEYTNSADMNDYDDNEEEPFIPDDQDSNRYDEDDSKDDFLDDAKDAAGNLPISGLYRKGRFVA